MSLAHIFDRLVGVSIQTALLVLIVLGLTRWLALSSRVRAGLWVLVFVHALAGMFVSVPLPVFASAAREPAPLVIHSRQITGLETLPQIPASPAPLDAKTITVLVWAVLVALLLLLQFRRESQARRLLAGSVPADDLLAAFAQKAAEEMGIRRLSVRTMPDLSTPCVSGLIHPTVYLPQNLARTSEERLRAVLVHELAHIRHGDLPASIMAAAARCFFFFHPMTWIAHREWAIHREAACDAEVLRRSQIGLAAYCDLLIQFAQGRPLLSATIQAATRGFSHLHRRICEMKNTQPKKRGAAPVATVAALVVSALAAIPVSLTARSAMTHQPEHASGKTHSIISSQDSPVYEVGPNDTVDIRMHPDEKISDPVLGQVVNLSLKKATFKGVIAEVEKAGDIKIISDDLVIDDIAIDIDANVKTCLDLVSSIGNQNWERVDDRTFKLVPAQPSESKTLKPGVNVGMFEGRMIAPSSPAGKSAPASPRKASGEKLAPSGEAKSTTIAPTAPLRASGGSLTTPSAPVSPVDAMAPAAAKSAIDIAADNGVTLILDPSAVVYINEILLDDLPTEKGVYDVKAEKDANGNVRFTFHKSAVEIVDP